MRKIIRKRWRALFVVSILAVTLTACSSNDEVVNVEEMESTSVEADNFHDKNEDEITKTESTALPTPESTAEPSPTPKPDTIDMESTLTGVEWLETFEGIVTEPVWVVFNDETNKKEIYRNEDYLNEENEEKIPLDVGDCLAVYFPNGEDFDGIIGGSGLEGVSSYPYFSIFTFNYDELLEYAAFIENDAGSRHALEMVTGEVWTCFLVKAAE